MKRLSLLAIDCKSICLIKVRYFKAKGATMYYFMFCLEDAEIILLTKKFLAMSGKYCRLEGELHS